MVARVAAQGMYSSEKVISARALAGPKPMPPSMAERDAIPAAEFTLFTAKSTAQLETTTSLAETPAIRATTICQYPRPTGAKNGTSHRPRRDPKVFPMSAE